MSNEVFVDTTSGQLSMTSGEAEHAAFMDKFKSKVTTRGGGGTGGGGTGGGGHRVGTVCP